MNIRMAKPILGAAALLLCLGLSACGNETASTPSLTEVTDGTVALALDGTQQDVEASLEAEGIQLEEDFEGTGGIYGTGDDRIELRFDDGDFYQATVGQILNQTWQETSNWSLGGVTLGSTAEDVTQVYGECTDVAAGADPEWVDESWTYDCDADGQPVDQNEGVAQITFSFQDGVLVQFNVFSTANVPEITESDTETLQ